MPFTSIHVLGERNSGTNYLLQLLKKNTSLPIYDTYLVHKHFQFDKTIVEKHPNVLFIVITKGLKHFLQALYNAPHHVKGTILNSKGISTYEHTNIDMKAFLNSRIKSDLTFIKNRPDVKYSYEKEEEEHENPIELYYSKLSFFLSLRANPCQNVEFIKYELLNKDLIVLENVLKQSGVKMKHEKMENVTMYKSDPATKYTPTKYHVFTQEELALIEVNRKRCLGSINEAEITTFDS